MKTISSENQIAQNSSPGVSEKEVFGTVDWETGDPKPIHVVTYDLTCSHDLNRRRLRHTSENFSSIAECGFKKTTEK